MRTKKMKQAQFKSIAILFMVFLVFIISVIAYQRIFPAFPVDEWVTDPGNSVNFNFIVNTTSPSISYCAILVNNSGVPETRANYTDVINATPHVSGISINDSAGKGFVLGWRVICSNGTDDYNTTTNTSFGMDGNTPSITLDFPASLAYIQNLSNILFLYTPTDTSNPDTALFYTNLSEEFQVNQTNRSYASGIQISVNLSLNADNASTGTNIVDAHYAWNAEANDSAGNIAFAGLNRTFVVDSVDPTTVSISVPATGTTTDDSTLSIGWKATTETNFDKYEIRVSSVIDLTAPIEVQLVTNISQNSTTLSNIENDGTYFVNVISIDLAGRFGNGTVINFTLNTAVPIVTLDAPLNNSFSPTTSPDFNVTMLDDNPSACYSFLSKKDGFNATINLTRTDVVNGTSLNLTVPRDTPMSDGVYYFNVGCNDTFGRRVNASSELLKITVDTLPPKGPGLISKIHQTNNTNRFPELKWVESEESNFSRYLVEAIYFNNNSVAFEVNVTPKTTVEVNVNLSANLAYYFNVTAFDRAGNSNSSGNTTEGLRYFVDPICGILSNGWSTCGATWTFPKNLSQIGDETDAIFVSIWNSSHQWATCNYAQNPEGQHCNVQVNISTPYNRNGSDENENPFDPSINHAVWIYVNETTDWRNRTWVADARSSNFTLTNASGIGWNLEGMYVRNGKTFGEMAYEVSVNATISLLSLPYLNGTSRPYVNKGLFRGINNDTVIPYGNSLWLFYNDTHAVTAAVQNTTYNYIGE